MKEVIQIVLVIPTLLVTSLVPMLSCAPGPPSGAKVNSAAVEAKLPPYRADIPYQMEQLA